LLLCTVPLLIVLMIARVPANYLKRRNFGRGL